jgi:hypothetical protein
MDASRLRVEQQKAIKEQQEKLHAEHNNGRHNANLSN